MHEELLLHMGQHHDDELSSIFVRELGVSAPDVELGIAGGSNTSQIARMLVVLEGWLEVIALDAVLVYGDTNSTLVGALAAAQRGVPVAHVEVGMRSYDCAMFEELNRVLTDHVAQLLLCSSDAVVDIFCCESVAGAVAVVGDVMVDVARAFALVVRERSDALERFGVRAGEYLLVIAHCAGNVDVLVWLRLLVVLLHELCAPTVLLLYLRMWAWLEVAALLGELEQVEGLVFVLLLGYFDFIVLLLDARAVFIDSGGV